MVIGPSMNFVEKKRRHSSSPDDSAIPGIQMASDNLASSQCTYFKHSKHPFITGKVKFIIISIVISSGFLLLCLLRSSLIVKEYMKSVHYRKIQNQPSTSESAHYAVMIDAGSSGSRVHLYTWPPYSEENRGLIKARMLKDYKGQDLQKQITPGLSSFANHPEDAFDYIYPLIEFANRNIPQNKHKETPLYILATAGMRLLSSASQEIILNNLRESVKSNSSFLFSSSNVEVITGKEEGIYSWISVNYLLNRYDHSLSSEHTVAINFGNGNTTRPQTVGMLEMGGASVQIAFEITSKYQLDDVKSRRQKMSGGSSEDVLAQVDLGNPHDSDHNYLVYVTTFLGLGVNVAKEAYLKYLIERERNNHSSSNRRPEVPAAADSSTAILSSTIPEIHSLTLSDPCMCRNCPLNVSIVSVDGQQYSLTLKGLGDFEQCENILQRLISPMQERNENTEWIDVLEKKGIIKKDKKEGGEEEQLADQSNNPEEKFKDVDELDEIDEEDERAFLEYRKQRLQEIALQQSRPRFGSVLEISRQDWVDEVNKAGQDVWVVIHVFQEGNILCSLINQYFNQLALKFPFTKFIRSLVSLCLPDFPETNLPAVFIYQNGNKKTQIFGQEAFGGTNLKVDGLEWMLSETGAIQSEMKKDPRKKKVKSGKVFLGVNSVDSDASDSD
ncbi:uncharacterized protein LOC141856500 isoform X1 [Brevipalpus obovatus]|uniref:uncharacterized protein LOC141856500 isoform X1 n=1 Tax=Brevipalpus obovatus TaxID=246614 RepID=UPI003D9ECF52